MTRIQLRTLLIEHGLNQREAAQLLGVAVRTVRSWLHGDRAIPGTVVQFFRLLAMLPERSRRQAVKLMLV